MNLSIPDIEGKELFNFLIKNKSLLTAQKKSTLKEADSMPVLFVNSKGEIVKAADIADDVSKIDATLIINTTNIMDSHRDVHIPGLWKKSLAENKELYLLQEHSLSFKGIITDQIKAFTQSYSWKDLGLDMPGTTEALVFKALISDDRNPFMFGEYKKGHVKNHSVGMNYVKIEMAINDEDYKEEFAVWNKYIDDIVNRDEAEKYGYFWAVKEAKVIEGSAVPIGSNRITPAQSIEPVKSHSTEEQPLKNTEKQPQQFDLMAAIKQTTFFKN